MNMRPQTFLALTTIMVAAALAGYLYLVDSRVLVSPGPSMSYPQYLLEASAEVKGKVIVESGSNSQHGIEPALLADYFKGPVIVVAQNAGFPLLPKIYNISRYAQKGDVLILPLEWNLYVDDAVLSTDYLAGVSRPDSSVNYYYQNLPLVEKVRFILQQFPLENVLYSLTAVVDPVEDLRKMQARLASYRRNLAAEDKAAFGGIPARKARLDQAQEHCDRYILGEQLFQHGFTISAEFRRVLTHLRQLADLGVSIYFTWPAVAEARLGNCYESPSVAASIASYSAQIRALIEASGFQFIGDFHDSRFPLECFADTPYHLTDVCAVERTRRLVSEFSQLGIKPTRSDTSPAQLLTAAGVELEGSYRAIISLLETFLPPVKQVHPQGFNTELLLADGWSQPEDWGVWSRGRLSTVTLRVAPALRQANKLKILVRGRYFNGREATTVTINGRSFGRHILTEKRFRIRTAELDDGKLHLQFGHHNPVSPSALGLGDDARQLRFGLTEIRLGRVQ
jgi:hypothetical protein